MFCFVDDLTVRADDPEMAAAACRQRHGNMSFGRQPMAAAASRISRTIRPGRRVVQPNHQRITVGKLGGRCRLPHSPIPMTVCVVAFERRWIVGRLRNQSPAARRQWSKFVIEHHFSWQCPKVSGGGNLSRDCMALLAFHCDTHGVCGQVFLVSTDPSNTCCRCAGDALRRGAGQEIARCSCEITVTGVAGFWRSRRVRSIDMTT